MRVLATALGFRRKYGYWPKTIEAEPELIAALATVCLTPLGFHRLQSKVELRPGAPGTVVAKGQDEHVFDYGDAAYSYADLKEVRDWIGLGDDLEAL